MRACTILQIADDNILLQVFGLLSNDIDNWGHVSSKQHNCTSLYLRLFFIMFWCRTCYFSWEACLVGLPFHGLWARHGVVYFKLVIRKRLLTEPLFFVYWHGKEGNTSSVGYNLFEQFTWYGRFFLIPTLWDHYGFNFSIWAGVPSHADWMPITNLARCFLFYYWRWFPCYSVVLNRLYLSLMVGWLLWRFLS